MESDRFKVFYPAWIKLLGVIGIPLLAIAGVWMAIQPVSDPGLTSAQQVLFPVMGGAVIYQCFIGSMCFRSFNTVLVLHDDGMDVHEKGLVKEYSWDELSVKHYAFATTLQIRHKNGQTIGYFSDSLENVNLLVHAIEQGIDQ